MQWLLDIVLEMVANAGFIKTSFVDRGDPANEDFDQGDLTIDFMWHELDLSAIVPSGASAIALRVLLLNTGIGQEIICKKHGNINFYNVGTVITQVANTIIEATLIIPVDESRKIDYVVWVGGWLGIDLTVLGWWL